MASRSTLEAARFWLTFCSSGGCVSAALGVVSLVILIFYRLHGKWLEDIEVELNKRRAADGIASTVPV